MKRKHLLSAMLALALIIIIVLSAAAAFAQSWPFVRNAQPFTDLQTLVTATTTTVVTGPSVTLGMPFNKVSCQTLWSAATLTTTTLMIQGSLDGTNYVTLFTRASATSPDLWTAQTTTLSLMPSFLYFRGAQSAKTGGGSSSTTTTELKCFAH
jgi:hypothetical protein